MSSKTHQKEQVSQPRRPHLARGSAPLAFHNTAWGRAYDANPYFERQTRQNKQIQCVRDGVPKRFDEKYAARYHFSGSTYLDAVANTNSFHRRIRSVRVIALPLSIPEKEERKVEVEVKAEGKQGKARKSSFIERFGEEATMKGFSPPRREEVVTYAGRALPVPPVQRVSISIPRSPGEKVSKFREEGICRMSVPAIVVSEY
ncbi:hypothetical protein H2203_007698 [Taxawa tesnikishii (nom. ined.)]|nr:hypothetical protein H2203_007698 [Dothideales sp. JES 119]